MPERPVVRGLLIACLLAFVGWGLVDYAAGMDARYAYPTDRELSEDFAAHHGEAVDTWVTVAERRDGAFVTDEGWVVTADRLPPSLNAGDGVQVHGTARPGPRIAAERLVVTDRRNRLYMLAVSALGLVLAVGATLRYWRPALGSGYLVPRTPGDQGDDGDEGIGAGDDRRGSDSGGSRR
jgi:hypothetical protein